MSFTDDLKASPPGLHGQAEFWGLAWEALAFIERTVQPGMATIETGRRREHDRLRRERRRPRGRDAVAGRGRPDPRRVRAARDLDRARSRFRIGSSADVLRDVGAAAARLRARRRRACFPVPDARLVVPGAAREGRRPDAPRRRVHAAGRRGRRPSARLAGLAARAAGQLPHGGRAQARRGGAETRLEAASGSAGG